MALVAAAAAAVWGAFNSGVQNRTQWKYLQAQGKEMRVQAQQIREIGASEIRLFQRQAQYRMGAIEAGWGHSGVAADSGSAFETLMAQAATHGLAVLQMQRNTALQARNMEVSATFADYQRRILDVQLPLQLLDSALHGAAAGTTVAGGTSFGQNFLSSTVTARAASPGSSQIGTALGT